MVVNTIFSFPTKKPGTIKSPAEHIEFPKLCIDTTGQYVSDSKNEMADAIEAAEYGSIGSVPVDVTLEEIYRFTEHTRPFWDFSNAIHFESVELIDIPFTHRSTTTLEAIYALNPSEVTIQKPGWFFGLPTNVSLRSIFAPVVQESGIASDFNAWADRLNMDTPSQNARDIAYEAAYWENECGKAAMIREVANEMFPPDVRANWPNMTPAERNAICERYAFVISCIMSGGEPLVVYIEWRAKFDAAGNSQSRTFAPERGNYIAVSDGFVNYLDGAASNVWRCIDAVTHETYHKYQYLARQNPGYYNCPQSVADSWNEPYIRDGKPHPTIPNYTATNQDYERQPLEYDTRAFASLCA